MTEAAWPVDLHSHSTCSDGALSPEALLACAAGRGLRVLALTDHDTMRGVRDAATAARAHGVSLVSGVEISAWFEQEIHILGYFLDPDHGPLTTALDLRAERRRARVFEIAALLAELGAPVDPDAILANAAQANVGRPHIARALLAAGHVQTMDEAFHRFLGRNGGAYVPASRIPAGDAIALIHDAGGAAVWAHPGVEGMDRSLPALAALGLDGLELRHPAHDATAVSRYAGLCGLWGLCPTGGSDYHGSERPHLPGDFGISEAGLAQLQARAPRPYLL